MKETFNYGGTERTAERDAGARSVKKIAALLAMAAALFAASCAYADEGPAAAGRRGGALSPEAALEYMKKTENLLIVDVATKSHYERKHFTGAVNIPIEELSGAEEEALYRELPAGRPVLMHCRLGMIVPGACERMAALRPDIKELAYIDGAPLFDEYNEWLATRGGNAAERKLLGGLTPEDALEYMKKTENLVIVEVNAPEWKLRRGFAGAMHIPYTEMAERCGEIPAGRPVLLYCGGGIVSVEAYGVLREKRPDIPQLAYIAGAPLVREYNEWLAERGK